MKKILTVLMIFYSGILYAFPEIEIDDEKYLRITYEAQFGLSNRDIGSGPNSDEGTNELNFRRNRIGFIGTFNEWAGFYFQTEYIEQKIVNSLTVDVSDSGRNFYVLDAQVRLNFHESFNVFIGKVKNNLTRENLEACFEPLTIDRSLFVYAPYKTSRDTGVVFWGIFLEGLLQYRLDAMNGHTPSAADPTPNSNLRYTARFHLSLLEPESGYGVAGTYIGEIPVLTVGTAYQYEAEAIYDDVVLKDETKDYNAYSVDIFYEQPTPFGAFTLSGAYLNVDFDDAYKSTNPSPGSHGLNGQKNGYYVKFGYLLPVEVGPGKLQLFGRYDDFKFANLASGGVDYFNQNIKRSAAGLNYYIFDQDLKLTFEYSQTDFDKTSATDPNYNDFSGFELFLQVRF
jgi:hypothetical protein